MYVSVEGIDGAGKGTVIEALKEEFPEAVYTREPDDDTIYGQYVRDVIKNDEAPAMTVFFAFLADHAANIENVVRPALDDGKMVICDRGIDSRYAYQTSELEGHVDDPLSWIRSIQEEGWSIFPDLTLYIDITPETAMERIGGRGEGTERFEKLDSLAEKRDIYHDLAEEFDDRYVVIDGEQSDDVEENKRLVKEDCINAIRERMAVAE